MQRKDDKTTEKIDVRDYDEHDYRRGVGRDYEPHEPVSPTDHTIEEEDESAASRKQPNRES